MIQKTVPYKTQSLSRIRILVNGYQMAEQNDRSAGMLSAELFVGDKEGQLDLANVPDVFVVIEKSENIFIKLNKK